MAMSSLTYVRTKCTYIIHNTFFRIKLENSSVLRCIQNKKGTLLIFGREADDDVEQQGAGQEKRRDLLQVAGKEEGERGTGSPPLPRTKTNKRCVRMRVDCASHAMLCPQSTKCMHAASRPHLLNV